MGPRGRRGPALEQEGADAAVGAEVKRGVADGVPSVVEDVEEDEELLRLAPVDGLSLVSRAASPACLRSRRLRRPRPKRNVARRV